ncbi:hypothetical protein [Streptomyces virginiae]|uniref:hypothetical protein n=1 Tax=Streptomyces virginiae TaxID=1961 RepID=UPI002DBC7038|nr:hypothetical protein [Streptomyces sp. CMAA1738]MEC4576493.1 hypothetical protein [Streptomyces sp. CMAA1738]
MYGQPRRANPAQPAMTFDQMLERVRYEGDHPTRERAEEAVRTVLAARAGTTPAVARWDTGAVLAVVARLAGPDLLARILRQLPGGYALLFGEAELRQPQPAL